MFMNMAQSVLFVHITTYYPHIYSMCVFVHVWKCLFVCIFVYSIETAARTTLSYIPNDYCARSDFFIFAMLFLVNTKAKSETMCGPCSVRPCSGLTNVQAILDQQKHTTDTQYMVYLFLEQRLAGAGIAQLVVCWATCLG